MTALVEVAATGPVKMAAADSLVLTTTLVVTAPVEVAATGSIEAAAGPVEVAVVDMVMTSVADDEGSRPPWAVTQIIVPRCFSVVKIENKEQ